MNTGSDSEGDDDPQNVNLSNRPTTSLEKAHHYFLVALAGDEVKSKLANEEISKDDIDKIMFQTYSDAVDRYMIGQVEEANRFGLTKPDGLTRDVLMATDSRSRSRGSNSGIVNGESLWRKYQELVSYLVNYANPVWDLHISLGKSRADCLHAVKLQLWEKVETERVERVRSSGKSCTPKSFRSTWMPKEWLAFITMGPPAGDHGKKTLCSKSKHAAQIATAAKAVVPLALDLANNSNNTSASSVTAAATAAVAEITMLGKRHGEFDSFSGKKSARFGYDLPMPAGGFDSEASRSLSEIARLKAFELKLHTMEKLIAITNDKELSAEYEALLRDYIENNKF